MIDANESITKTNSGISNLISVTQLCDPIFMLRGAHKEPNTYIRGSDRIDYFFVNQNFCNIYKGAESSNST